MTRARVFIGWQLPTCLPILQTSDTSLQNEKVGEQRLVLFVASCVPTCLPTVFVPFTHTNLSLATSLRTLVKFAVWRPLSKTTADADTIETLRKPRRQRERHQAKGLMSTTMAAHVRYNSWFISLPSFVNQRHQMTNGPISIYWNSVQNNRPQYEALGNKYKVCGVYSPEPRTEVFCAKLNFNTSKLVYFQGFWQPDQLSLIFVFIFGSERMRSVLSRGKF